MQCVANLNIDVAIKLGQQNNMIRGHILIVYNLAFHRVSMFVGANGATMVLRIPALVIIHDLDQRHGVAPLAHPRLIDETPGPHVWSIASTPFGAMEDWRGNISVHTASSWSSHVFRLASGAQNIQM